MRRLRYDREFALTRELSPLAFPSGTGVPDLRLKGFMVRKEAKGHGTNRFIEGPVKPGDRVAFVEDVVTTRGSSILAIERCREFGLVVDRVIAIIDRMEGGREAFAKLDIPFESLLTIRDFGIEPPTA